VSMGLASLSEVGPALGVEPREADHLWVIWCGTTGAAGEAQDCESTTVGSTRDDGVARAAGNDSVRALRRAARRMAASSAMWRRAGRLVLTAAASAIHPRNAGLRAAHTSRCGLPWRVPSPKFSQM
jgi:hypothetical protein